MIIWEKNLFLKKDIDKKVLELYGFRTLDNGDSYWKDVENYGRIGWFNYTRRFVFEYPRDYDVEDYDADKILRYLNIPFEYLELKYV